jgi:hypothetical protein
MLEFHSVLYGYELHSSPPKSFGQYLTTGVLNSWEDALR